MNKTIFKSIGAIFIGFILVVIISIVTDLILEKTRTMKQPFDLNSTWFIVFVLFYRSLYATIGAYITALLAPSKPMKHALIGGGVGFALSVLGAIVMWDKPPHWYAISLIIISLPCAWLGGKIFLKRNKTY